MPRVANIYIDFCYEPFRSWNEARMPSEWEDMKWVADHVTVAVRIFFFFYLWFFFRSRKSILTYFPATPPIPVKQKQIGNKLAEPHIFRVKHAHICWKFETIQPERSCLLIVAHFPAVPSSMFYPWFSNIPDSWQRLLGTLQKKKKKKKKKQKKKNI
jgi:hypothetical protein